MPLPLNILVIGPPGSGKSSLITSMVSLLQQIESVKVSPIDEMGADRRLQYNHLKDIFSSGNTSRGDWTDNGIVSTKYVAKHEFSVSIGENLLNLIITEIPGCILTKDVAPITGLVRLHEVVFITIDTPILMEGGFSSSNRNHIGTITDFLIEQWGEIASHETKEGNPLTQRRVILVPLKSEKYTQSNCQISTQDINTMIKTKYVDLLNYVHTQPHIKAYITHAHTLGDLVFDHWEGNNSKTKIAHYSYLTHAKYTPRYCEQPFLYALYFVLEQYKQQCSNNAILSFFNKTNYNGIGSEKV